jgi:hypothetical protein
VTMSICMYIAPRPHPTPGSHPNAAKKTSLCVCLEGAHVCC